MTRSGNKKNNKKEDEDDYKFPDIIPPWSIVVSYIFGIALLAGWSFLHKFFQLLGINILSIDSDLLTLSLEYVSYGILSIVNQIQVFYIEIIIVFIGITLVFLYQKQLITRFSSTTLIVVAGILMIPFSIEAGKDYAIDYLGSQIDDQKTMFPKVQFKFKSEREPNLMRRINVHCLRRVFEDRKRVFVIEGVQGITNKIQVYTINKEDIESETVRLGVDDTALCTS